MIRFWVLKNLFYFFTHFEGYIFGNISSLQQIMYPKYRWIYTCLNESSQTARQMQFLLTNADRIQNGRLRVQEDTRVKFAVEKVYCFDKTYTLQSNVSFMVIVLQNFEWIKLFQNFKCISLEMLFFKVLGMLTVAPIVWFAKFFICVLRSCLQKRVF